MYSVKELNRIKSLKDKSNYIKINLSKLLMNENFKTSHDVVYKKSKSYEDFIRDVKTNKLYIDLKIFNLILTLFDDIALKKSFKSYCENLFFNAILLNPHFNNEFLIKNFSRFKDYNYVINCVRNKLEFNEELINFIIKNDPNLVIIILKNSMYITKDFYDNDNDNFDINREYILKNFIQKIPFLFWTDQIKIYSESEAYFLFEDCEFTFEQIYELAILLSNNFNQTHYQTVKNKYVKIFSKSQFCSLLSIINLVNTKNKIIDSMI